MSLNVKKADLLFAETALHRCHSFEKPMNSTTAPRFDGNYFSSNDSEIETSFLVVETHHQCMENGGVHDFIHFLLENFHYEHLTMPIKM